jgi:Carboxypeptidase regulatory-like domain
MRPLTSTLVVLALLLAAHAFPDDLPPGEIAGTVTDEAGQPIEGAVASSGYRLNPNQARTDKSGHFHLAKLDKGRNIELRISKDGFSPWFQFSQPTGIADLKVTLTDKTYLQGTVYSPDAKPVPNALVRADCGPKRDNHYINPHIWLETRTDADGHYKLFVWPDHYLLRTRVPDTGVADLRADIAAGQSIAQDIHLEPGIRFVVNCIDGDTGAPVPAVKLNIGWQKGMHATSDANGQAVFENMPADKFEFDVESKTHVRWWSPEAVNKRLHDRPENLTVPWEGIEFLLSAEMQPVTIKLERGVKLSGRVVDPAGNPVPGAAIATAKVGWGDSIDSTKRFTAYSDADGAFSITLPASGGERFTLIAHDGDYNEWRRFANGVTEPLQTQPGEDKSGITIQLTTPATIKGQVLDRGGTPQPDKWVRAMSADDRDSRYTAPETHTDADGNFELKFVRPGDVLVQVEPFFMKSDFGQTPPIAATQVTVSENEVKEGVRVTAGR